MNLHYIKHLIGRISIWQRKRLDIKNVKKIQRTRRSNYALAHEAYLRKHNKEIYWKRLVSVLKIIYYSDVPKFVYVAILLACLYDFKIRQRSISKSLALVSKTIYYLDVLRLACVTTSIDININLLYYLKIQRKNYHVLYLQESTFSSLLLFVGKIHFWKSTLKALIIEENLKKFIRLVSIEAHLASIQTHVFTLFTTLLIFLLTIVYI